MLPKLFFSTNDFSGLPVIGQKHQIVSKGAVFWIGRLTCSPSLLLVDMIKTDNNIHLFDHKPMFLHGAIIMVYFPKEIKLNSEGNSLS